MYDRICVWCEKEFTSRWQRAKFCSRSCTSKWVCKNRLTKIRVISNCPVCGKEVSNKLDAKKIAVTCSHSCANTFFRSGKNNGRYKSVKDKAYRTVCFESHQKKCIVCGEDKIVAVHHYDGNNKNNELNNLIPLCPTHHVYIHSRYKDEIIQIVEEYRRALA